MTTAKLVNLICDKLRTGRVRFLSIGEDGPNAPIFIEFEYGWHKYKLTYQKKWSPNLQVCQVINEYHTASDQYSQWVEGVLNGKTRDESGVLS